MEVSSAIQVVIPPMTYCSGSFVEGEIRLNFRRMQEDRFEQIFVTLRGRAHSVWEDDSEVTERDTIPLVDIRRTLWTYGSEYPPPDSDVLRLFFRFQLPEDIPPSFLDRGSGGTGVVLYSVTAVGIRPGVGSKPWKHHTAILVMPYDDVSQLLTRSLGTPSLVWRMEHKEKKVRKGVWGDYATVRIELSIPDIPVYPLFARIPFRIDISTITAPLTRRARGDSHAGHGEVFPAPPARTSDLSLQLIRRTKLRTKKREHTRQSAESWFLGPGRAPCEHVNVNVPEKEWVPMHDMSGPPNPNPKQETGVWVQCAQFTSNLVFNVSPTFSVGDRIEWDYRLKLTVPFPGLGNDVELEIPRLTIVSGLDKSAPRKPYKPGPGLYYHNRNLRRDVSEVSLPWEYWQGHSREWDEFYKGIDARSPRA